MLNENLILKALECGLDYDKLSNLLGVSKEHLKRMQNKELSLPLSCALRLVIQNHELQETNKSLSKEVEILRNLLRK